MDRTLLERKSLAELREIAATLELRGYQRIRKADLIDMILGAGGAGSEDADRGATRDAGGPDAGGPDAGGRATDAGGADGAAGTAQQRSRDDQPRARSRARRRDETTNEGPGRSGQGGATGGGATGGATNQGGSHEPSSERGGSGPSATNDADRDDDGAEAERGDDARRSGGEQRDAQGSSQDGRAKRDRRRKSRGGPPNQHQEQSDDAEVREGVLDLLPEGYGFLRVTGYLSGSRDVYVSQSFVRRFDLRRGDKVAGPIRRNKNSDKFPALARIDTIEGEPAGDGRGQRADFKDLTPLFPDERLRLEVEGGSPMSMRLIDMISPIGKGQRGLLVSPPKAGKTTVLKQLAHAIEHNDPDVHLMVLLVDERPEEVTDFERSTGGEVIASTFDRPPEDHTQVAELAIERAKRLVERGRDVVILLDSITRLGRAYNLATPVSGRILSGGIDSAALYPPKRFFGAARNIEEGGSLTIIATALVDTGSKMDEVIFEEFKGTGNMELRLDRRMEQKRIFPAIDIQASGTRREELLLGADELDTVWKLRRLLATMDADASIQLLMDKLKATRSNAQFLQLIAKSNLQ